MPLIIATKATYRWRLYSVIIIHSVENSPYQFTQILTTTRTSYFIHERESRSEMGGFRGSRNKFREFEFDTWSYNYLPYYNYTRQHTLSRRYSKEI